MTDTRREPALEAGSGLEPCLKGPTTHEGWMSLRESRGGAGGAAPGTSVVSWLAALTARRFLVPVPWRPGPLCVEVQVVPVSAWRPFATLAPPTV